MTDVDKSSVQTLLLSQFNSVQLIYLSGTYLTIPAKKWLLQSSSQKSKFHSLEKYQMKVIEKKT